MKKLVWLIVLLGLIVGCDPDKVESYDDPIPSIEEPTPPPTPPLDPIDPYVPPVVDPTKCAHNYVKSEQTKLKAKDIEGKYKALVDKWKFHDLFIEDLGDSNIKITLKGLTSYMSFGTMHNNVNFDLIYPYCYVKNCSKCDDFIIDSDHIYDEATLIHIPNTSSKLYCCEISQISDNKYYFYFSNKPEYWNSTHDNMPMVEIENLTLNE